MTDRMTVEFVFGDEYRNSRTAWSDILEMQSEQLRKAIVLLHQFAYSNGNLAFIFFGFQKLFPFRLRALFSAVFFRKFEILCGVRILWIKAKNLRVIRDCLLVIGGSQMRIRAIVES